MTVAILPADNNNLERLQKIAQETFYRAFIHETTEQNMLAYLSDVFSLERLQQYLDNREVKIFILCDEKEDIGYIKLNVGNAQTEMKTEDGIEIERFYIKEKFQGKGYASKLMEQAINIGVALEKTHVWLGVAETNVKAVKFYSKHGFTFFGEHKFMLGEENQVDLLMRRSLI